MLGNVGLSSSFSPLAFPLAPSVPGGATPLASEAGYDMLGGGLDNPIAEALLTQRVLEYLQQQQQSQPQAPGALSGVLTPSMIARGAEPAPAAGAAEIDPAAYEELLYL